MTVVGVLPMFLLGALAVQVRAELGFDRAALGVALGLFLGVGSVFSAASGWVADRVGPGPSMRVAATGAGLAMLVIGGVARSWILLLVGILIGGVANAIGQPAANLHLSRQVPPDRQGLAFGVRQSAAPASSLIGGLTVPLLALTVGWRWAFVGAGLLAFAVAALPTRRATPATRPAQPVEDGDRLRVAPLVVLALAGGLGFASASALTGFLVDAAVAAGMREASAGVLLSAGSVVAIVTRVGLGRRADGRSGGQLLVVGAMFGLGSLAFPLLATQSPPWIVMGALVGFCLGWGWSGLFFYSVVRLNSQAAGTATGIVQTGAFLGGVIGPIAFGAAVESWGYPVGWLIAGAWCAMAGVASVGGRWLDRRLRNAAAHSGRQPLDV